MRTSAIERKTKETDIYININLDGRGEYSINTGIPFLDHMLELFAKHGFFDLEIKAEGDLEVDCHHTMEDIGLVLGLAIQKALGGKKGIKRYGYFILPMDETRVTCALDLSGRPYLVYGLNPVKDTINNIDTQLFNEFFQALSVKSGLNLHLIQEAGGETHHIFEAAFKAFAKALDIAVSQDDRLNGEVLSTKGKL
ncbi:MAG: imidazoleglycerol-phosphate dehydratase HisB [Victivallales bacterium]|nr:imidazoleglycerol-phosphate dehydratase HisB [Victivallales bacterium]MCF7889495.1 imidazoleglycerol-phosphate dehydratase HisB [Victivallales bacterium]